MIYKASLEEVTAYREAEGMNQSLLKLITKGVSYFNDNLTEEQTDLYFEEKEHFIIGSAVDCMITEGDEDFDARYFVASSDKKPSDTIMSIVKMSFDTYKGTVIADSWNESDRLIPENFDSENLKESIEDAIVSHAYQPNWGAETKYNKVVKDGKDYWEELIKSDGKQILSVEQYTLVKTIVNSILTHPHTAKIFELAKNSEEYDIVYQFPIFFDYKNVSCKGLLDMVFIDHNNRTISPVDLKTLGDYTINFPTNLRKRRYDFQASYYTEGLSKCLTQLATKINKHLIGYTMRPFTFIVESTKRPGNPLLFVCSNELLHIGKHGFNMIDMYTTKYPKHLIDGYEKPDINFTEILGFDQAIDLYIWYNQHGFDTDKIVKESNGVIKIDWHGIKNRV